MTWFFVALIPPFLYALSNHTDKYLISKYVHEGKVGALIIFSALFGLVVLPLFLLVNPAVLNISPTQAIVLMAMGSLVVLSILCYLYALEHEEASLVVPLYQTIPIFGFILAYFILGETLSSTQALASLAIIIGALVISFDIKGEKIKFKKKVVVLMLVASLMYATSDVLFKLIALDRGFWISTFWTVAGKIFIGIIFLIFVASYRREFWGMLKNTRGKVFAINSANETVTTAADIVFQYAVLLAPVALVLMVNSFQPLFVFLIGLVLTLFFPRISEENISKPIMTQKILGIGIILTGSLVLLN